MTATMAAEEIVRARYPDLDPDAGPGAARRWNKLLRLVEVAQEYQAAQGRGENAPTEAIAEARGVAPATVRTWLHRARQEGFDVPSRAHVGSTGDVVRQNVRTLREQRKMTYVELTETLDTLGRPIPVLGLRRLEAGERRVDVDDLIALAEVFGVTPSVLLEPLPGCGTCHGAPPPGFVCATCGAGPVRPGEEPTP